jgi:hypothetical protein
VSSNILIGVGGTGAKLVEASIHAAVAGLTTTDLAIGFVDQDNSNGNVKRAEQLLANVIDARGLWRDHGRAHDLGQDSALFRTNIQPLAPKENLWVPHSQSSTTLARIFGRESMTTEDRHVFDLLFAAGTGPNDTEQDLALDEGYRGRPHIGSAAMTARIEGDVEFWKQLLDAIKRGQAGAEVRLMLAGSVFGGTGAAGFPTLTRLIRRRLREGQARNVKIGGLLMLPYFGFSPPSADQGSVANVARTEELIMQARGALKYYDALFKQERVFYELYLVGWDRMFELGYHSPGAKDQANPPLPPELVGSMAISRFFEPTHEVSTDNTNPVFVSARADSDRLQWSDLPSPIEAEPDAPYEALGGMLRFAVAWKHWAPVVTARRNALSKLVGSDPWYKAQGVNQVDFQRASPEQETTALSQYTDSLLTWASAIQGYADRARLGFSLWRTNDFTSFNPENPQSPVTLNLPAGDEARYGASFNNIVPQRDAGDAPPTAAALLMRLNSETLPDTTQKGLGRFVAAKRAFSEPVAP